MTSGGVDPSKRSMLTPARSALLTYWRCLRFRLLLSTSSPTRRSMTRVVGGWTFGAPRQGELSNAVPYGVSGLASGSARTVAIFSAFPSARSARSSATRTSGSSSVPIGPRGTYARCQPTTGMRRSRSCAPASGWSGWRPSARRTGRQPLMARTSPHSHSCGKAWYGADSTNEFQVEASVTRQALSWLPVIAPPSCGRQGLSRHDAVIPRQLLGPSKDARFVALPGEQNDVTLERETDGLIDRLAPVVDHHERVVRRAGGAGALGDGLVDCTRVLQPRILLGDDGQVS